MELGLDYGIITELMWMPTEAQLRSALEQYFQAKPQIKLKLLRDEYISRRLALVGPFFQNSISLYRPGLSLNLLKPQRFSSEPTTNLLKRVITDHNITGLC